MSEQVRPSVERDPLVAAPAGRLPGRTLDPGASASDDPILARLALWLADVAAEAPRGVQQPPVHPVEPAPRTGRA